MSRPLLPQGSRHFATPLIATLGLVLTRGASMKQRFDNIDRKHVIATLERSFGSRLEKVGKRDIYLKNSADVRFVVLGGNEDWHGIPDDVIEDVEGAEVAPVFRTRV